MDDSKLKHVGSQLGVAVAGGLVAMLLTGAGPAGAFNVPTNSVNSAKIVDNSIQGIDIKNGTISNQDVVLGQRTVPINHRGGDVTDAAVATLNGIAIRVTCSGGDEVITVTKTALVDAEISVISNDAGSSDGSATFLRSASSDTFNAGDTFAAGPDGGSASERQYTLMYSAANGRNVTAMFVTEDGLGADECIVSGYAVG